MKDTDKIRGYCHMNRDAEIGLSIPQIAVQLKNANYGQQRMLAEIVKIREESEENKEYKHYAENTKRLRDLLEGGWY